MPDIHNLAWLGAMALIPALLLLLAGFGWRKIAGGIALSLGLPLVGAVLVAVAALMFLQKLGGGSGGSGEWSGFGHLGVAVLAGGAAFLAGLVVTVRWQVKSGRMTLERGSKSNVLLFLGSLAALFTAISMADIVVGFTPKMASTDRLIQHLGHGGRESPVETELVQRGPQAVPAIIAELQRHPYVKKNEDDVIELVSVPALLRVLGRIGGAEATAEIRRWTAKEVPGHVRAVAIDVLAMQGDRSVVPLIVEMLGADAGFEWQFQRPELFHALGVLKAGEQVGLIRSSLRDDPAGGSTNILHAVTALAAIDTDEAWALIAELAADKDADMAEDVVRELAKCPGPHTIAFLSKILDDPDPTRQQAAYAALQRIEPRLLEDGRAGSWSEANAAKLRAALKKRAAEQQ